MTNRHAQKGFLKLVVGILHQAEGESRKSSRQTRIGEDLAESEREILFEVPGTPVPKARPRVTENGTYTPQRTREATDWVKLHAKQTMRGEPPIPKSQGVSLFLEFYRKRAIPARPDLVNYVALVADALQGVVYEDDCQVITLQAHTFRSMEEHTWIRVRGLRNFGDA